MFWRAHVPKPGEPLWPPLSPDETVEIPPRDAQALLERNPGRVALLADDARTVEDATGDRIRPGSLLIAHSTVGCLDTDGHWDPEAADTVPDVAILSWGLALTRPALTAIFEEITPAAERVLAAVEADEYDEDATDQAAATLAAEIAAQQPPPTYARVPQWREFGDMLAASAQERLQAGRAVVAFAGIGRPEKFFETLESLSCTLAGAHRFADHHPFRAHEVLALADKAATLGAVLATTAKDAVRLPESVRGLAAVLEVALEWCDGGRGIERLLDRLGGG